jgi:hypothetical protein
MCTPPLCLSNGGVNEPGVEGPQIAFGHWWFFDKEGVNSFGHESAFSSDIQDTDNIVIDCCCPFVAEQNPDPRMVPYFMQRLTSASGAEPRALSKRKWKGMGMMKERKKERRNIKA